MYKKYSSAARTGPRAQSALRNSQLRRIFFYRIGKAGSEGGACGTRGFEEYFFILMERPGRTRSLEEYFFIVMERPGGTRSLEEYFLSLSEKARVRRILLTYRVRI